MFVVVRGFRRPRVDATRGVDELFDGDVAVPALSVKVPRFRRGIFHAGVGGQLLGFFTVCGGKPYSLERVVPCFSSFVRCNVVSAVGLVDADLTLGRRAGQLTHSCLGSKHEAGGGEGGGCEPFLPYSTSAEQSEHPRSAEQSRKRYKRQCRGALNS